MIRRLRDDRGTALIELAVLLPFLLMVLLLAAEIGMFLQSRLIVTSVSREGGSIGSRQVDIDDRMLNLLASAGLPLDLTGPDGRIIVTRVTSGETEDEPQPRVVARVERGGLSRASTIDEGLSDMGLSEAVHDRLVYRPDNGTADIAEVTVVEVYYKHRPFTPFQAFLADAVLVDGDGTVMASRAIF